MDKKNLSDDELEEELEKAIKISEKKRDVFKILRKEKESVESKDKRIKDKFGY
ncbi:MAG: hypothetical protein JSV62_00200 [Promethearchaeota archaeon]|nr:MAG: hypothetical protein JSV62_00200 [Candidatus Lokiarchaeota archaeon]